MNLYIIVEGEKTEMQIYPKWISFLAPQMTQIENAFDVTDNNYYIFSGKGIPSIYNHIVNAIKDINDINAGDKGKYDYLLVCMDTETVTRKHILSGIDTKLKENDVRLELGKLLLFEHKICIESWLLGNDTVFKENPQTPDYLKYIQFYNVGENCPENMGNINPDLFSRTAHFHIKYLKRMLEERNMRYSKNDTEDVCTKAYLEQLIKRYKNTGHIPSFGSWYEFIVSLSKQ